jgi:hypothetical protein
MQIDSQLAMDIFTLVGKDPAVSVYKRLVIAFAQETVVSKKKKAHLVTPAVKSIKDGQK